MAASNASGSEAAPELVVKIIGSKHIKHFIQGEQDQGAAHKHNVEVDLEPPKNCGNEKHKNVSVRLDSATEEPEQNREDQKHSSQHIQSKQIIHRNTSQGNRIQCLTAPSGDHTLSYIHYKTPEGQNRHASEPTEQIYRDALLVMLSSELQGWGRTGLRKVEMEVEQMDSSHKGTIDRTQLASVFLNNDVPLKLPTLRLLLQAFYSTPFPNQIHYKGLLKFVSDALMIKGHKENKESAVQSVEVLRSSESTSSEQLRDLAEYTDRQTWLQRFQKAESAIRMSDTKNTGYIDKDQAKRLFHNYNQIFILNLTPVKISEAIRCSQYLDKVHLATALQHLQEL